MCGGGVGRDLGTGRDRGVAVILGVLLGVTVAVDVAVGVTVGVTVAVALGLAVGVAVGVGEGPDCTQYLPPLFQPPPQTIISVPVQIAV